MKRGPDSGSVAIEAAILAPVLLTFVLIAVVAGRIQTTGGVVDAAARSGARAASLARSADGAQQAAAEAVQEVFKDRGVRCADAAASPVEFGTLETPTGPLRTVTVKVSCTVSLDYLLVAGTPGTKTMTSTFTSVVDRYRGTG
ncbi:hypothetical protein GCM10010193_49010 [Kitasatospora atroaurantiaca]|uniref:TadE-like protein n=1 Tax=Kitasatospora atroaurantiaca TaxID=285545 RepID=A0A561EYN7_9ACTN|nr:TadE family protein [Kitasatospora atroaurantiaca]TWE20721.1 TadE-like protein [Kitasatospora atroaurantiaca]